MFEYKYAIVNDYEYMYVNMILNVVYEDESDEKVLSDWNYSPFISPFTKRVRCSTSNHPNISS